MKQLLNVNSINSLSVYKTVAMPVRIGLDLPSELELFFKEEWPLLYLYQSDVDLCSYICVKGKIISSIEISYNIATGLYEIFVLNLESKISRRNRWTYSADGYDNTWIYPGITKSLLRLGYRQGLFGKSFKKISRTKNLLGYINTQIYSGLIEKLVFKLIPGQELIDNFFEGRVSEYYNQIERIDIFNSYVILQTQPDNRIVFVMEKGDFLEDPDYLKGNISGINIGNRLNKFIDKIK